LKISNTFTIYNASAGSGKTFTLVKEYLLLLFTANGNEAYKNILAITFTNKAVDEMKSRIIESLKAFSAQDIPENYSDLFSLISQESGLNENQLKAKSQQILKNIIHNYAAFEISTIDGFTHRILRTFAKDLGIPVNFEVELNTEKILLEAVESLINKAGTDKNLTKVLVDFALTKADDDKSWDITRDLFEISKLLTNENNQIPLQALKGKTLEDFKGFAGNLKEEIASTAIQVENFANEFFAILEENNLDFSDFNRSSLPKYFEKLQKNQAINDFNAQWIQKLKDEPLYKKSFKDEAKKSIIDQLQPEITSLFDNSKTAYCKLEFLEAVKKNIVQLSLLNAINHEIEEIKKEHSLLLISEFNPRISAEVKGQPAPFIYERLGERYQNYFIDEFQDTSQMQWENLMPLIDHSLSGMASNDQKASLMLVGDAKQSIYRWRGGKAEQFIDLYSNTNPFSIEKEVINLPFNYRSGGRIVDFNNSFFHYASQFLSHPDYKDLFESSFQESQKDKFGYVNISFIEAENKEQEFEFYPIKILEIIRDLDEKGFAKNDICILTRQKSEGIAIAGYLSEQGISVISSETLLISRSPEVTFITDLMRFSLNPTDNTLKLSIFDFLKYRLKLDNPHQVITENLQFNEASFFDWLKNYGINFESQKLQYLPLYESVEYIIRIFSLVEGSDAYIQFFLDFVHEATQKEAAGVSTFLEVWDQKKSTLSIVVPKEEDAVQVMTIHKAKGLEFPILIYPFANSTIQDTRKDSLWLELEPPLEDIPMCYLSASKKMLNWTKKPETAYKELIFQKELDAINVLYVALTRASQQLYILSKNEIDSKGNENKGKISGLFIGFLKEKGLWNEGLNYEFGKIEEVPTTHQSVIETRHYENYYSSSTQGKAVNIITRSGSLWDTKQEEAIEKGQIIHDILAEIKTDKDIETAIANAVKNGVITKEIKGKIKSTIQEITSHPDLRHFYSGKMKIHTERDILTASGKKLRPDRLNFDGNNLSIIDYKTGKFKESHKLQIEHYSDILDSMGFLVIKKILVYINKEISVQHI